MKIALRAVALLFGMTSVVTTASFAQSGWTPEDSGTDLPLHAVFFIDAQTGWAVGGACQAPQLCRDVILHTTDGGDTWTFQASGAPTRSPLNCVFCIDANTACASVG